MMLDKSSLRIAIIALSFTNICRLSYDGKHFTTNFHGQSLALKNNPSSNRIFISKNVQYDRTYIDFPVDTKAMPVSFKYVTWNILAKGAADSFAMKNSKYYNIMKERVDYLPLEHRLPNIVRDLISFNADIICLQEADFYQPLKHELRNTYEGIIQVNTTDHDDPTNWHGPALFIDKSTFSVKAIKVIEFRDYIPRMNSVEEIRVGILAALKWKESNSIITVGCTHFHHGRSAQNETRRVKEADAFLHSLKDFAKEMKSDKIILSGDLNSEPGSDTYRYLTGDRIFLGTYNYSLYQLLRNIHSILYDEADREEVVRPISPFNSAYSNYKLFKPSNGSTFNSFREDYPSSKNEPDVTCAMIRPITVDYIFYTNDTLTLTSILSIPPLDVLQSENGGLPSSLFGSDHVSLAATFSHY